MRELYFSNEFWEFYNEQSEKVKTKFDYVIAIDHNNIMNASKIFLLNAFLKKSTKDYKKQIITVRY